MGFFVGIGAQKAGTSWVAAYLRAHPQVFFSPDKELHYFDAQYSPALCGGFHERKRLRFQKVAAQASTGAPSRYALLECLRSRLLMEFDETEYVRYFQRHAGNAKAFGEITPSYSMLGEDGFQAILRLFPEANFLFILRNPADRFWSQVRQKIHDTQAAAPDELFRTMLSNPQFLLRTDYQRTLKCLTRVAPRERLLVLFYEHLFNQQGAVQVKRLTDFLAIDFLPPDLGGVINKGLTLNLSPELKAAAVLTFAPIYTYIRDNFADIPQNWIEDMRSFL